jgi:hypothetical protein
LERSALLKEFSGVDPSLDFEEVDTISFGEKGMPERVDSY